MRLNISFQTFSYDTKGCGDIAYYGCRARITPALQRKMSWRKNLKKKAKHGTTSAAKNSFCACGNGKKPTAKLSLTNSASSAPRLIGRARDLPWTLHTKRRLKWHFSTTTKRAGSIKESARSTGARAVLTVFPTLRLNTGRKRRSSIIYSMVLLSSARCARKQNWATLRLRCTRMTSGTDNMRGKKS